VISEARAVATTAALLCGLAGCDEAFHFDVRPSDAGDAGLDAGDDGASTPGACTSDATCGGLRCEITSGLCVACLQDADCAGGANKRCEPTTHVCVACLNRPDCAKRQDCDTVTHRCLDACFDSDDPCPTAGFVCSEDLGRCIECRTSANCAGSAGGLVCDVPIGRCVQCTSNAQCPSGKPVCDRRTGQCQVCVASVTCGGAGAFCDPSSLTCRSAP
jgi:Cys-rich repeat protein